MTKKNDLKIMSANSDCFEALKECLSAIKWAQENCKPDREELYCDFFNVLQNAASHAEDVINNNGRHCT